MSIDTLDNGGDAVVSGTTNGAVNTKMLWKFVENINECIMLSQWNIGEDMEYRGGDSKMQYVYENRTLVTYIYPTISRRRLNVKCN